MTQWFEARQRTSDGRWDYTCRTNSTPPHPIGYCAGWREHDEAERARLGDVFAQDLLRHQERLRPFRDKFHTDGHATADEASDCHRRWLCDTQMEIQSSPDVQRKCKTCSAWTFDVAIFRGDAFDSPIPVCPAHATPDAVLAILLADDRA